VRLYSVYYVSVGSSTCFGCWHPQSGARTTVITASGTGQPGLLPSALGVEFQPGWGGTAHLPHPGPQQAASSVHYTITCKHSLVLLRMGEIIAGNMLSWLKLLIIKSLVLHLVGFLYYCISDARSDEHQIF